MATYTAEEEAILVEKLGGKRGDRLVETPEGDFELVSGYAPPVDPVEARNIGVSERTSLQAQTEGNPKDPLNQLAKQSHLGTPIYGGMRTAGMHALRQAIPSVGALVGGAMTANAASKLIPNKLAGLAVGVPASVAAGIGINKGLNMAQDWAMSPGMLGALDESARQNPLSAQLGSAAPGVAAMRPSFSPYQSAYRVGRDLVRGGGYAGIKPVVDAAERSGDLANIYGAGIGAAIPLGRALSSTNAIDSKSLAIDLGQAALFNSFNKYGAKALNKIPGVNVSSVDYVPRPGEAYRGGLDFQDPLNIPKSTELSPDAQAMGYRSPEEFVAAYTKSRDAAQIDEAKAFNAQRATMEEARRQMAKEEAARQKQEIEDAVRKAREEERLAIAMGKTREQLASEKQSGDLKMDRQSQEFRNQELDSQRQAEQDLIQKASEEAALANQMGKSREKLQLAKSQEQLKMDRQAQEVRNKELAQQRLDEAKLAQQGIDEQKLANQMGAARNKLQLTKSKDQLKMDRQTQGVRNNELAQQKQAEQELIDKIKADEADNAEMAKLSREIDDIETTTKAEVTVDKTRLGELRLKYAELMSRLHPEALDPNTVDVTPKDAPKDAQYAREESSASERISEDLTPEEISSLQGLIGRTEAAGGAKVDVYEGGAYTTPADKQPRVGKFTKSKEAIEFASDSPEAAPHEVMHSAVSRLSRDKQAALYRIVRNDPAYKAAKQRKPNLDAKEFIAIEGSASLAKQIKDQDFGLWRDLASHWRSITGRGNSIDAMRAMGQVLSMGAAKDGGSLGINRAVPEQPKPGPAGTYRRYPEMEPDEVSPKSQELEGGETEIAPTTDKANIVPDTAETVRAQLDLALDPASSRKAVLYTGDKHIGEIPTGLRRVKTNHGTVDYNPRKISESAILDASNKGFEFDARVLGMSSATKPADLTSAKVVSVDTASAKNVQAEVVDESSLDAATKAATEAVPGGKVSVKDPEQLISERTSDDAQYAKIDGISTVDRAPAELRPGLRRAFRDREIITAEQGQPINAIAKQLKARGITMDRLVDAYRGSKQLNLPIASKLYKGLEGLADFANNYGIARPINKLPRYVPESADRAVRTHFTKDLGSPESKAIIAAIGAHWKDPAAAEQYAKYIHNAKGVNTDYSFGPARKQAGLGLPPEVKVNGQVIRIRENDPTRALQNYVQRMAKDIAWHKNVEVPHGHSIDDLSAPGPKSNDMFQLAKQAYVGQQSSGAGEILQQGSRLAGSTVLGTITGFKNILGQLQNMAAHGGGIELPVNIIKTANKMATDWVGTRKRAIERGVLRPGQNQAEYDARVDNPVAYGMHVANNTIRLLNLGTPLEDASRTLSMAFAETVSPGILKRAKSGNKHALNKLKRFAIDPRDPNAVKQLEYEISKGNEGHYDPTESPPILTTGMISDLGGMMKWSVERSNKFYKDVLVPAREGNLWPLAWTIAASMGINLGYDAIDKFAKKRRGNPQLNEIEAAEKDVGKPLYGARMAWFTDFLATTSLIGYAGNLANAATQLTQGKKNVHAIFIPLDEVAGTEVKDLIGDTFEALNKGEPKDVVLKQFSLELVKMLFQAAKPALNQLDSEAAKVAKSSDVRDAAVYKQLTTGSVPKEINTNPMMGSREVKFKETKDLGEAGKMAKELFAHYDKLAGNDPFKFFKKVNELKAMGDRSFPNKQVEGTKFMQYLENAYGKAEAKRHFDDWVNRHMLDKYKRKMIPDVPEDKPIIK